MPREIVRINVASKFPIEAGARFFSTIAHPDNRRERERYHLALCRFFVIRTMTSHLDLANKLNLIAPGIFSSSDDDYVRDMKRGNKNLRHRLAAARWLLMPHLRDKKSQPLQIEKDGEFIVPTVNKITLFAMEELGWTGKAKSIPTFKSKVWATSRPVVHACGSVCAWALSRETYISYRATSRWFLLHVLLAESFDDSSAYTEV